MIDKNIEANTWYLLYCKPRQELRAQQHLANQGFHSFLPVLTINKLKAGKQVQVTEPIFPRYLFLQINSTQVNLSAIRSTRGIKDFVRFGQHLAHVPEQLVSSLCQEQIAMQEQENNKFPYNKGDQIKILNGPFSGIDAVYDLPDGEQRSIVLLSILGQWVQTTLDNRQLGTNLSNHS